MLQKKKKQVSWTTNNNGINKKQLKYCWLGSFLKSVGQGPFDIFPVMCVCPDYILKQFLTDPREMLHTLVTL